MEKEKVFHFLNYTHNELQLLLNKLDNNHMLTESQYYQLVEEIGLNNISTFTGDYEDLINQPHIPIRLSDLFNDMGFISEKDVIYEINDELIPLREQLDKIELVVSTLNKLDLEMISDDLAELQNNINFLNKMFEELRRLNNSFSSQLETTNSEIKDLSNDIDIVISEQNYLNQSIKSVKDNIRSINETKMELIKTTDYLKDTMIGDNEYEFEKSIVEVLKETRGDDFSESTRTLDEISKILETLIGIGDGIDENTFGVLMQKVNEVPELICVREYIYKIDSIYEQLGKEGLLEFLDDFRIILDALESDNKKLKEENQNLHDRINQIERLHVEDMLSVNKTLKQYDVAIKAVEETLRNYDVVGLKALVNKATSDATRAYNYADSNKKEIVLLQNRINNLDLSGGDVDLTEVNIRIDSLNESMNDLNDRLDNSVNDLNITINNLDVRLGNSIEDLDDKLDNSIEDLNDKLENVVPDTPGVLPENIPQHICVTEEEYYNNYTEEQRRSENMWFIITEYEDEDNQD
jgi:predicted  nucleic acid-binding Zn-ribbon protein